MAGARIYIEDAEDNFLYLDLADHSLAATVVATVNATSNGKARIERELEEEELEALPEADRANRWRPHSSSYRHRWRRPTRA